MRRLGYALLVVAVVALPGRLHAADLVKLRPLGVGAMDEKGVGLKGPEGLCWDGGSRVVVADSGGARVVSFAFDGERFAPGTGMAAPQLPYPIRVQVDSRGDLLVLDGKARRIGRLSPAGEFKGYVEFKGVGSTPAVVPRSFKLDRNDNLYILDVLSARVLVMSPDGALQREIPFPQGYGFFSDLTVNEGGTIYLIDCIRKQVFSAAKTSPAFSPLGKSLKEDVNFPVSIATGPGGDLYILDQNGSGIVILGQDGSFRGRQLGIGWREGLLRHPAQLAVTGAGVVFVADRGNNRIQAYSITR